MEVANNDDTINTHTRDNIEKFYIDPARNQTRDLDSDTIQINV